ncbi:MAG: hypothetical protein ACOC8P_00435 [Dichotomicrobium sp.]
MRGRNTNPFQLMRLAALAAMTGQHIGPVGLPSGRLAPPRHRSKKLDKINDELRDDEARKAKAEAKRQRRMERNRRIAGKDES